MLKSPLNNIILYLSLTVVYLFFLNTTRAFSDDVGITKARLIQKTAKSYVLEVDITQPLAWTIKAPIFPNRFKMSEPEYITQSGWVVVQSTAMTNGEPLSSKDEILLPWLRNGADISFQWLDGTVKQGLFLRSTGSIRVPLSTLIPPDRSLVELCRNSFFDGLHHFSFGFVHILFASVLALLIQLPGVFKSLLCYTFGQAFSLILADMGLPGFDLLFADILGLCLVFLLSHAAVRKAFFTPFLPLLFLFGLLHGLAYAQELNGLDLPFHFNIPMLFMFNMALDIGQFCFAFIIASLIGLLGIIPKVKIIAAYGAGTLSIILLCFLFQEKVITGKTDLLQYKKGRSSPQYSLPILQNSQATSRKSRGTRQLTSPIMNYLSVEPFEVRQEILISARVAVRFLGVDDTGMGSIPLESQKLVKDKILTLMQEANPILIDGQPGELILSRADFITLGPAGVIVRTEPIQESLNNGIIGITLIYKTPDLADRIEIAWQLFSETVQKIEATATDPFGSVSMILSPNKNTFEWKSRLVGYRVAVIEKIVVEKPKLPVISVILFLFVLALFLVSILQNKELLGRSRLVSIAALGFGLYPFVRFPLDLPFVLHWTPSTEQASVILDKLLTNVYRSFDVRNENDVYDRLALSVSGDQLTNIYLENRQSLEFENRGGARANFDKVEVLAINEVNALKGGEFVTDAVWTVSGSVNHFGHTHYRQNKYHAKINLIVDDNSWKIMDIKPIDEERLL